jgi:hypothetical protein
MPKYSVLITSQEYVEVDGDDAKDAEMKAYRSWKRGDFERNALPEFLCEEADLIEETEDEL